MARLNVPNCITCVRILGAVFLIFIAPLSALFYVVYTVCGLSDLLDGYIARTTKTTTEFGSKLDSVADLLFYTITIVKLLPTLWKLLPTWLWYVIGLVVFVRLTSYGVAAVKFHRFASMHSIMNKLSSGSIFLLPYFLAIPNAATGYSLLICVISGISSTQELVFHLKSSEYTTNIKELP